MKRSLLALVGLITGVIVFGGSASAYYAEGYIQDGNSYGGGYVQITIQSLSTPDCASGGHINNTIWVYAESVTLYWMEVGYTYGFESRCILTYYWARNDPVAGYAQRSLERIDPIGTVHEFEGQEVFVGEYDVYIDNVQVASDVNLNPWTIRVETGLEYYRVDSVVGQTVNYDWHQVRTQACCSWIYWPTGGTINTANHTWTWTAQWNHATVAD